MKNFPAKPTRCCGHVLLSSSFLHHSVKCILLPSNFQSTAENANANQVRNFFTTLTCCMNRKLRGTSTMSIIEILCQQFNK
mmetsp:Transcript_10821/g.13817  ORF Transcript_10821/g.13817 Transcript_10821/m.13817 type:complete len:81 (-) Transcript_10821:269-511(-)